MYSRSIHYLTSKLELYTEFGRKNGKLFTHPFRKNFKYFWEKSLIFEILYMTNTRLANNLILTNISTHVSNLN